MAGISNTLQPKPPASNTRTVMLGSSDSLDAMTLPADPAPTIKTINKN